VLFDNNATNAPSGDGEKNMKAKTIIVFSCSVIIICGLAIFAITVLRKQQTNVIQQNHQVQGKTTREFEDIPHSANPVGNGFSKQQALAIGDLSNVRPFGNDIYYFPFVEDEFRYTVSAFLSVHTNLEVITVSEDVVRQIRPNYQDHYYADYGATIGHTVFFREKH